ncbi:hypothetical protein ACS0TY_002142 [Phlomoides rotata]
MGLNQDMKVSELMTEDGQGWNSVLVHTLFSAQEANRVCSIPICKNPEPDALAWRFSEVGEYTAKFGYFDGCEGGIVEESGGVEPSLWQQVWSMDVIPKIRFFTWRMLHGILPTSINLISRFHDVDPMCVRCGEDIETMEHCLRYCPWVSQYWDLFPVHIGRNGGTVVEWVSDVWKGLDNELRCCFLTALWGLWFDRNKVLFEKEISSQAKVHVWVGRHRGEYLESRRRNPVPTRPSCSKGVWIPPELGRVKLNADASVKIGVGWSIAGVVRDDGGRVKWCYGQRFDGLEFAIENGVRDVVVETDSQMVIRALLAPKPDLSHFERVIRSILEVATLFDRVTYSWVRRTGNCVAHRLALFACSSDFEFFLSQIPDVIVETI